MPKLLKIFSITLLLVMSANAAYAATEKSAEKQAKDKKKTENQKIMIEMGLDNLTNDNYQYFESTIFNFQKIGEKSISPLIEYLKNAKGDKEKELAVIYTLGRMGKMAGRAVPLLVPYITNEDYDLRISTMAALGKIGPASDRAVPAIKGFITDSDEWQKNVAIRALREIGTPQSLQAVKEYENTQELLKQRESQANEAEEEEKNNK